MHPEAAGEFQEGLNASAASGQGPRARRREGTTFPVAAVHGVKRTAKNTIPEITNFKIVGNKAFFPRKPVLLPNCAIPVPPFFVPSPDGLHQFFPNGENRKREEVELHSCNPRRGSFRSNPLILKIFT